jgi:hypothetical protein
LYRTERSETGQFGNYGAAYMTNKNGLPLYGTQLPEVWKMVASYIALIPDKMSFTPRML